MENKSISGKLRIVFIVPSFHTGGSERVILYLVQNLDRAKFDIVLLVLKKEGALIDHLPGDIKIVYFNFARTVYAVGALLKYIRRNRPEIVFSTLGHVNLILALLKPFLPAKTFLIARESSIVSIRNKDERYPKLFDFLFKTVYKRFHCIICQSEYMENDLTTNFGIDPARIVVINNPIDFRLIPKLQNKTRKDSCELISVGQLRREKGYERVIDALSKCNIDFNYSIIGGGSKDSLELQIKKLKLEGKIKLLGQIVNPFPQLSSADCLLLGSYYEGFPNVVLEANACGVPVIAFRAPGGHNEIIRQGYNGWFIDKPEELCDLITSRAFDSLDKEGIIQLTRDRYELFKIIEQYQNTIMARYSMFRRK